MDSSEFGNFEEIVANSRAAYKRRLTDLPPAEIEKEVASALFGLATSDGMAVIDLVMQSQRDESVRILTGVEEAVGDTDEDLLIRHRVRVMTIDRLRFTLFKWPVLAQKAKKAVTEVPASEFHPGRPETWNKETVVNGA